MRRGKFAYRHAGYTVAEVLITVVVIAILGSVVLFSVQGTQTTSRDSERVSDIDNINSKLEEFYSDNGGYPETINAANLAGISPEALVDPGGVNIEIIDAVSDQVAAQAEDNPTLSINYKYIPYPTGCSGATCTGYVLKSYIERPTERIPNPYIKTGLHNN